MLLLLAKGRRLCSQKQVHILHSLNLPLHIPQRHLINTLPHKPPSNHSPAINTLPNISLHTPRSLFSSPRPKNLMLTLAALKGIAEFPVGAQPGAPPDSAPIDSTPSISSSQNPAIKFRLTIYIFNEKIAYK